MIGDIIPSFLPFFLSFFPSSLEIKKMKNGMKEKREEHVKNVKRFAGQERKC